MERTMHNTVPSDQTKIGIFVWLCHSVVRNIQLMHGVHWDDVLNI